MDNTRFERAAAAAAMTMIMLLAGCGGGGGSDTSAPAISVHPANAAVVSGDSATFTVVAAGDGLTYQWYRNGVPIEGAAGASYTTSAVGPVDEGAQYTVAVSNAGGSVTSSAAQLHLALSSNQQIYESLILSPAAGSFGLSWNLSYSGPQSSGTNYAYSESIVLPASPLTHGRQATQVTPPVNMASTLSMAGSGPARVLKDGAILVVPANGATNASTYVGGDILVETLASDNATVAYSQLRTNYSSGSLTGTIGSTPSEFAHWFNSFFSNPAILNAAATYASGAGYMKYTAVNRGDRYNVFDCASATLDANVTPCRTGMTLVNAMTAGINSASDGTTYHLADGTVTTVSGVPVWVSTAARPVSTTLILFCNQ